MASYRDSRWHLASSWGHPLRPLARAMEKALDARDYMLSCRHLSGTKYEQDYQYYLDLAACALKVASQEIEQAIKKHKEEGGKR